MKSYSESNDPNYAIMLTNGDRTENRDGKYRPYQTIYLGKDIL